MNQIALEEEIIMVTTETIHKLFSYENGSDVVALYMFYHKQCKMQGTNQSFSTGDFVKKGMKFGNTKFIAAKKVLKDLGLIEDIVKRDDKGQVEGWYIKLNFIRSLNKAMLSSSTETHPVDESTGGGQETNAGSSITINAGSSEKVNATQTRVKKKKEEDIIVIPSREEILSFMGESKAVSKICDILEDTNIKESQTLEGIKKLYEWMIVFFQEKYAGKFYVDKDGNVIGSEIVYNELDKFVAHYSEHQDKEILCLKARIKRWITNSTTYNQKK